MTRLPSGVATLLIGVTGCHDWAGHASADASEASVVAVDALAGHMDAAPPARCALRKAGVPADVSFGDHAELGEAVAVEDGFVIGALRAGDGGRLASVLRTGAKVAPVDLGLSWGDAPAPQPIVLGNEVFAVGYVRPASTAGSASRGAHKSARALSLYRVAPVERLIELPPEADASSAYDVLAGPSAPSSTVGAVIAWDDDVGTPPHATIQLAVISRDLHATRSVRSVRPLSDAGPSDEAATDPRLVARAANAGYWLTWLAHHPEHAVAALPLPAGEIETPSEEATYSWVEAIALDGEGVPIGQAKALTSVTGHVGSYAVGAAARGTALVVVAEDDGAFGHGEGGGSLERVTWRDSSVEVRHIVRTGVDEEAPPTVVAGAGGGSIDSWASFTDVHGDTEILPLLSVGQPLSASGAVYQATVEPLLSGARLLGPAFRTSTIEPPDHAPMAVASTEGAAWTLRWVSCTR